MKIGTFFYESFKGYVFSDRPSIKLADASFEAFKEGVQSCCNLAYDFQLERAGIAAEQLAEAVRGGYVVKREYTSWEARQRGLTRAYVLTVKGIRAIYKAYKVDFEERQRKISGRAE